MRPLLRHGEGRKTYVGTVCHALYSDGGEGERGPRCGAGKLDGEADLFAPGEGEQELIRPSVAGRVIHRAKLVGHGLPIHQHAEAGCGLRLRRDAAQLTHHA